MTPNVPVSNSGNQLNNSAGQPAEQPVALITGAGKKRVGWNVAVALARRGFRIAIHYRSSAAEALAGVTELKSTGTDAMAVQADLADATAIEKMVQAVRQQFGRIDVLVNCAAIWESKRLEEVTADDVRRHFEVNTLGTFLCCQKVGLQMVQQPDGGLIVNFGDWADARPYTDYAAYFPSKGAVASLTRCLAVELGSRNPRVRVNAILPGPVMLPEDMPADVRERVVNATLVRREGTPDHIALAILSFVDNNFLTGVLLPVDGGRTIFSTDSIH